MHSYIWPISEVGKKGADATEQKLVPLASGGWLRPFEVSPGHWPALLSCTLQSLLEKGTSSLVFIFLLYKDEIVLRSISSLAQVRPGDRQLTTHENALPFPAADGVKYLLRGATSYGLYFQTGSPGVTM